MKNLKIYWLGVMAIALLLVGINTKQIGINATSRKLAKSQQNYADRIAEVAIDNWETYGVLPSVAVGQAFIESTLGDHCRGYNLWGIKSGAVSYSSLDEGIHAYLKVINNGYYKNAPFCKDWRTQIRRILDGGYCVPEGKYYSNISWSIEAYNFDKYDKKLFKKLEKKEKAKKEKERKEREAKKAKEKKEKIEATTFKLVYSPQLSENTLAISSSLAKKGVIVLYKDNVFDGYYDVYSSNIIPENCLGTSNMASIGNEVTIMVYEEDVNG